MEVVFIATFINSAEFQEVSFHFSVTYSSLREKKWLIGQGCLGLVQDWGFYKSCKQTGRMGHVAKYWNLLNICQIRDYVVCQKESPQLLWKSHRGIFPRKYCKTRINYEKFAKTSLTTVEYCDLSRAEKACLLVIQKSEKYVLVEILKEKQFAL